VPTPDGAVVGRTMELGIPAVKSELENIYLHPRGTKVATLHGSLPASRFGYLAVQFTVGPLTLPLATTEGMNEAGLTISLQTHVLARYESANASKAVAIGDLSVAPYLMGCCATVDEAVAALTKVNVQPTPVAGSQKTGSVHFSLQDASGSSRVLEYIDGELRVYDNTEVGVLTNDPSYEWQLGNLNQYAAFPTSAGVSTFAMPVTSRGPFTSISVESDARGLTTTPTNPSHGLHSKFLPGGWTPPDRFVRMFLLKQLALAHEPPQSVEDGIVLATGLLNTVHIPRGSVAGSGPLESTNWACVKVPRSARGPTFYYRTYDNMQWKKIELGRIDWTAEHAPIQLYESGLGVRDATPDARTAPLGSPAVD